MLDENYWENRYQTHETQWDLGEVSPPLKAYFDQLTDKNLRILIPGCGNAHEAEHLHRQGFTEVFIVDYAPTAIAQFKARVPDFPEDHALCLNFFDLDLPFDLMVEQTFFCALNPELRPQYAEQAARILGEKGKLIGLFFQDEFEHQGPPFGGNSLEYLGYFSPHFEQVKFTACKNSIPPRMGRELFAILKK